MHEVLDERFHGFAPSVDPEWAGFWTLDDHRGGPPPEVTGERCTTAQERFALIASGTAVAAMLAMHASVIAKVTPAVVAIPLSDADPALITLVGREDCANPRVAGLREVATQMGTDTPG